ncbi:hypothetical protein QBC43DRAFT_346542 [Cladorrhinum sp. PSN259]|nr:hypothetical protein QBC43DRAFT_346542 [Cladorrhinum sp. PSN259]
MSSSSSQTIPTLTFYHFSESCSFTVRVLLNELSLPFSSVKMIMDYTTFAMTPTDSSLSVEEYRSKVHHMGYVPGLRLNFPEDGSETSLTETPAILSYLISLVPEKETELLGKTQLEKHKSLAWLIWLSGALHAQGYGPFFVPGRYISTDDEKEVERVKKAAVKKIESCYESIEKRIPDGGKYFQGGDEVTVVDLNAYIFWRWGKKNGFEMDKYPKYSGVCKRVEGRESVRRSLEEEGLEALF